MRTIRHYRFATLSIFGGRSLFRAPAVRFASDPAPGRSRECHIWLGSGSVGVASQIEVLAVPGASFNFSGAITALNVGSGSLALVDPSDQKSYQISFIPSASPVIRNLHIGPRVRVTARFNGFSYIASDITAY